MLSVLDGEAIVWVNASQMHRLSSRSGVSPARTTVCRYIKDGRLSRINGHMIRLEGFQDAGALYTSLEAWDRFHQRLNDLNYLCPGCKECEDPQ